MAQSVTCLLHQQEDQGLELHHHIKENSAHVGKHIFNLSLTITLHD